MRKEQHGFTIIELLVAVAIIVILAGMLLPALVNARESVKLTFCKNNMKQLHLAVMYYTEDVNGLMPPVQTGSSGDWTGDMYTNLLPFLDSTEVFWCPSSEEERFWDGTLVDDHVDQKVSYGFNYRGNGGGGTPNGAFSYQWFALGVNAITQRNISEFVMPSQLILVTDSNPELPIGSGNGMQILHFTATNPWWMWGPGAIHHNFTDAIFADGHVNTSSLNDLDEPSLWSFDNQ